MFDPLDNFNLRMKKLIAFLLLLLGTISSSCKKENMDSIDNDQNETIESNENHLNWSALDFSSFTIPNRWSNLHGNHYQWIDINNDNGLEFLYRDYNRIFYRKLENNLFSAPIELVNLEQLTINGELNSISSFTLLDHDFDGDLDLFVKYSKFPWNGANFLVDEIATVENSGQNNFSSLQVLNPNALEWPDTYEFGPFGDYTGDDIPDLNLMKYYYESGSSAISSVILYIFEQNTISSFINSNSWDFLMMRTSSAYFNTERIQNKNQIISFGNNINANTSGGKYIYLQPHNNGNPWNSGNCSNMNGGCLMFDIYTASQQDIKCFSIAKQEDSYSSFLLRDVGYLSTNQHASNSILSFSKIQESADLPINLFPNSRTINLSDEAYSVLALDYNSDGKDELILTHPSGEMKFDIKMYSINETDTGTTLNYIATIKKDLSIPTISINQNFSRFLIMRKMDFNNDGKMDIYFEHLGMIILGA